MAPTPIPFPPSLNLTFFAEGAANIVYRLSSPSSSASTPPANSEHEIYSASTPPPSEIELPYSEASALPSVFEKKLLRLRKKLPNTTSVLEAQTSFEETIRPLFTLDQLVDQVLVSLPKGLLPHLNAELRAMEERGTRTEGRKAGYLDEAEEYGVLVTDMSPQLGEESGNVHLEFKPKWLAQSNSAPVGAKRCRTCALRAKRIAEGKRGVEKGAFCPLDLVGGGEEVRRAAQSIWKRAWRLKPEERPNGTMCAWSNRVASILLESQMLRRLRDLQIRLEGDGLLGNEVEKSNFLIAMTLRDCTLYLQVPQDADKVVEGRLGDLDMKSPAKAISWIAQERQLIDEGWYMGSEVNGAHSDILCALQRASEPSSGTVKGPSGDQLLGPYN